MAEADPPRRQEVGQGPCHSELEPALRHLIGPDLTLRDRTPSIYSSTHHIERVSVDTDTGPLQLVCKYGRTYIDDLTGHRRGAEYEAAVYSHLFPDDALTTPRCHGLLEIAGMQCLVLDFVSGYRVHHSPYPRGLLSVCQQLALFHRESPGDLPQGHNSFDRAYFVRMAAETAALRVIPSRAEESMQAVIEVLDQTPKTVVHGELYPQNVIVNESGTVVLDWETAGLGPGVMDLAVLTQGSWDSDLVAECEEVYLRNAGLTGTDWVRRSLAAARVFSAVQLLLHLRGKETDGVQEALAVEAIATHLAELEGY